MAKMVCNLFGTLVQFITESLELILYSNQALHAQINKLFNVAVVVLYLFCGQFLYVKSYFRLFKWLEFILSELEKTISLCWWFLLRRTFVECDFNFHVTQAFKLEENRPNCDTKDLSIHIQFQILSSYLLSFSQFMIQSRCCCVMKCVYSFIFNKLAIKVKFFIPLKYKLISQFVKRAFPSLFFCVCIRWKLIYSFHKIFLMHSWFSPHSETILSLRFSLKREMGKNAP